MGEASVTSSSRNPWGIVFLSFGLTSRHLSGRSILLFVLSVGEKEEEEEEVGAAREVRAAREVGRSLAKWWQNPNIPHLEVKRLVCLNSEH